MSLKFSDTTQPLFCVIAPFLIPSFLIFRQKKKKKKSPLNVKQIVIYLVCILKTSCAQEPPVFLVHRGAGEEHSFGKAGMQEIALVALWAHCFIVEHDWAECLGYSDVVGIISFPWLTSSQRQVWITQQYQQTLTASHVLCLWHGSLFELCWPVCRTRLGSAEI